MFEASGHKSSAVCLYNSGIADVCTMFWTLRILMLFSTIGYEEMQ